MPIGRGIYFYSLYVVCWEWFPNIKGFVTGLITGAVGLGSLIFSVLSTVIVNPDNVAPYLPSPDAKEVVFPLEVANRMPRMFRWCLLCWSSLSFFGWVVCRRNPAYLNSEKAREAAGSGEMPDELKNYVSWKEAM